MGPKPRWLKPTADYCLSHITSPRRYMVYYFSFIYFLSFFVVDTFYTFSSRAMPPPPPTCSVLTKTHARRPSEHVVVVSTDTHAVLKTSCSVCFLPPWAYDTSSSVITPAWWRWILQCVQSDGKGDSIRERSLT